MSVIYFMKGVLIFDEEEEVLSATPGKGKRRNSRVPHREQRTSKRHQPKDAE